MARKSHLLHFRMSESTLDMLDLTAMSKGVTRSEIIRNLIEKVKIEHMAKDNRRVQVLVRLDYMQHNKIQCCASKAKMTVSELIRTLIEKELRS